MKRLAVARLWHEGNSFSPVPTTLAQFRGREWLEGEDARAFYRGTATELGAAVSFAESASDWGVTFLRCAAAAPGGPVKDGDFDAIAEEILNGLARGRWDAVYLSLHGALVTPTRPRPELELLLRHPRDSPLEVTTNDVTFAYAIASNHRRRLAAAIVPTPNNAAVKDTA